MPNQTMDKNLIQQLVDRGELTPETGAKLAAQGGGEPEVEPAPAAEPMADIGVPQWMSNVGNAISDGVSAVGSGITKAMQGVGESELGYAPGETQQPINSQQSSEPEPAEDSQMVETGVEQPTVEQQNMMLVSDQQEQPASPIQSDMQMVGDFQNAQSNIFDGIQQVEQQKVDLMNQMAQNQFKLQEQMNQRQVERQQMVQEAQRKFDEALTDIKNTEIEPNRYWKNASTGQKIFAALGAAFSGFGSDPGRGVRMINELTKRDIQLQKDALAGKRENLGEAKGIYAEMLKRFDDDTLAEQASYMTYLEGVKTQVQALEAQSQIPYKKAQAAKVAMELQNLQAETYQNFQKAYLAKASLTNPTGINPQLLPEDQRERYVPGYGIALTKEGAAHLNKKVVPVIKSAQENLDKLLEFSKKSLKSVNPSDRAQAAAISQLLMGQLKTEIVGEGAVSESEWKLLRSIIRNPSTLFSLDSSNVASLKTIKGVLERSLGNQLESFGLDSGRLKTAGAPQ